MSVFDTPQPVPVASAPASEPPTTPPEDVKTVDEPAFKAGQIVKTPTGAAIVVKVAPAYRLTRTTAADGTTSVSTDTTPFAGYVVAQLGPMNEMPHTAEELGLEAI